MMDNLIGEVNKVAAFAKAEQVTAADIAAVAEPVLDARIFDMTNHIPPGIITRPPPCWETCCGCRRSPSSSWEPLARSCGGCIPPAWL